MFGVYVCVIYLQNANQKKNLIKIKMIKYAAAVAKNLMWEILI